LDTENLEYVLKSGDDQQFVEGLANEGFPAWSGGAESAGGV